MASGKQGSSPKKLRYGKKQANGNSRAAYFVTRQLWRAAKNKRLRIERNAKQMEKDRLKKEADAKSGD